MSDFVLNTELVPPNNINVTSYTNNSVSVLLNTQYQFVGILLSKQL